MCIIQFQQNDFTLYDRRMADERKPLTFHKIQTTHQTSGCGTNNIVIQHHVRCSIDMFSVNFHCRNRLPHVNFRCLRFCGCSIADGKLFDVRTSHNQITTYTFKIHESLQSQFRVEWHFVLPHGRHRFCCASSSFEHFMKSFQLTPLYITNRLDCKRFLIWTQNYRIGKLSHSPTQCVPWQLFVTFVLATEK